MSNLVPQLRPDKNGKMVTRHVKADTSGSENTRSIPSPSLGVATAEHEKNFQVVWESVNDLLLTGTHQHADLPNAEELQDRMGMLDANTVKAYRTAFDDEPNIGFEDLLLSVLSNELHSESAGYLLFIAQQHSDEGLDNYWDGGLEGTVEYDNAMLTLRGLHQFSLEARHPLPKHIVNAEDHERKEVSALVRLIQQGHRYDIDGIIKDWGADSFVIADVELGDFALEHPDEVDRAIKLLDENEGIDGMKLRTAFALAEEYGVPVDRIVDIISERKTADMDTLRLALHSEAQSLSNGTL